MSALAVRSIPAPEPATALPFVSVVVPLYNEERWIEACVRALLALDYPPDRYEVLVVDNNSNDRSAERVGSDPRVRLLREPLQGDFAARNRGIAEARGEIIAFTDADTAPQPGWLRAIVAHFQRTGASLLVGRLEFTGRSRMLELLAAYEAEKGEFVFASGIPSIYFGYTCNMAVTRELLERIGPFAPVFRNADVVMVRRAVDELSPRALAFCDDMRVRRLEVATLGQYLGKQRIYGSDFPRYAQLASAETLGMRQRFRVYANAVRRNRLGPLDSAALLALLGVGAICYDVSRRRAAGAAPPRSSQG
jgi:glycosyltransferase involved in cell wall biosynthesis